MRSIFSALAAVVCKGPFILPPREEEIEYTGDPDA